MTSPRGTPRKKRAAVRSDAELPDGVHVREALEIEPHDRTLHDESCLAWSPNGRWLAVGIGNGELRLREMAQRQWFKPTIPATKLAARVSMLAWSVNSELLVAASDAGDVACFNVGPSYLTRMWVTRVDATKQRRPRPPRLYAAAINADENVTAVCGEPDSISFLATKDGKKRGGVDR